MIPHSADSKLLWRLDLLNHPSFFSFKNPYFFFFFHMAIAIAFPSYSCSSSTSADYFRLAISRAQTRSLLVSPISGHHLLPRFTGLKIHCPSKILQLPKAFRRPHGIVCEASLGVPTVTDETWESLVLDADCPVLVEFWAPWCGPCRMFHPVVEELSRQYVGRLKCLNLNTDDNPSIASKYGIQCIPTVMIFVNGEKEDAIIGAVPKTTLTASIDKFL